MTPVHPRTALGQALAGSGRESREFVLDFRDGRAVPEHMPAGSHPAADAALRAWGDAFASRFVRFRPDYVAVSFRDAVAAGAAGPAGGDPAALVRLAEEQMLAWATGEAGIGPELLADHVLIWSATSGEIKACEGGAVRPCARSGRCRIRERRAREAAGPWLHEVERLSVHAVHRARSAIGRLALDRRAAEAAAEAGR